MKKLYALLLVGLLSVGVVSPAGASNSPTTGTTNSPTTGTTGTTTSGVEQAEIANVVSITVAGTTVTPLYESTKSAVIDVLTNKQHLMNLGIATNAKVAITFDLNYSGTIPASGVVIPVKVTGANVGDYAYIVHRSSVTGSYSVVGQGILGDNLTVNGTFTDFSPVAVMLVDAASVSNVATSPKTGE